jgi:hypothetical protein
MCPGISGPGIRVYPFTDERVGFGLLLERDGRQDQLFLGTPEMKPAQVVQALVAMWQSRVRSELSSGPPPFVFLVDETDMEIGQIVNDLRMAWPRLYPGDTLTVFVSNASKIELKVAVSDVLSDWNAEHPGVPYPAGITVATEH